MAQATVLGHSVKRHEPEAVFLIVLADKKAKAIDYSEIPFEVVSAASIEPQLDQLARKYGIVELNTCIKPRIFEYLFSERSADRVVYLDPDIRVYAPLAELDDVLDGTNIALTPHILTPIPLDGKNPTENLFLACGLYNLGFIAAKRSPETQAVMAWWKDRTYAAGYVKPEAGMFVDQLYMNLVPLLFSEVSVMRHEGYNMAPWNLHERTLSRENDVYLVNATRKLVFFHFSSFRVDSGELPVHYYNRFSMRERSDMADLYARYNEDLKSAGYHRYHGVPWAYGKVETPGRFNELSKKGRALCRDGVMWGLRRLPPSFTERAYRVLKESRG